MSSEKQCKTSAIFYNIIRYHKKFCSRKNTLQLPAESKNIKITMCAGLTCSMALPLKWISQSSPLTGFWFPPWTGLRTHKLVSFRLEAVWKVQSRRAPNTVSDPEGTTSPDCPCPAPLTLAQDHMSAPPGPTAPAPAVLQ